MSSPKQKLSIITLVVIILLVILAATGGCIGYYYYNQYSLLKTDPQAMSASEINQIVAQVSQLMQLPSDEIPQVATVMNPSLVQSHTPFTQTETGDVILIYTKTKRAILYRPSTHKIIDVAPVIIGAPSPTLLPTQIPTETISRTPSPSGKAKLFITTTPK